MGLIFYPGGKVEYEAYAPLMQAIAQKGILCVLVHMTGNLAVLDMNAADGIQKEFPDIQSWYIGGHSLGGAMVASYVSKHTNEYKGLVLLGAYSPKDLSKSGLKVICLYGTNDQILDKKSYNANIKNLPENFVEDVIAGGCHGYFGDYGHQKGDGKATISVEEQTAYTADKIKEFILS